MHVRLPIGLGLRIAKGSSAARLPPMQVVRLPWRSAHAFWLLPVGAFMVGAGVLASQAMLYYETVPDSPTSAVAYVLLAHAFLALLLFALALHGAAVVLFNRTTVSAAPGRLIVRQGPLPPSETRTIRTYDILRLAVEPEPRLMPPHGYSWKIVGHLANGRHATILGGLRTQRDADAVAQRVADHCGLSA